MNNAALEKVRNNILTTKALSVLGPKLYAEYLGGFLTHLPQIARARDLHVLDELMGRTAKKFHYRGTEVTLDCAFCDAHIKDGSFAFGLAREIYIRDCYLKFHAPAAFTEARTILDLGANRGAFSVLMAAQAEFVLSVEVNEDFVPVINHNMQSNGCRRFAVETVFIGARGKLADGSLPSITMEDLLQRHDMQKIDFVKMDIEGSEFALFESAEWLEGVKALSMEIHLDHGHADQILGKLKQYGFLYAIADDNLNRITDVTKANFVYAWRGG